MKVYSYSPDRFPPGTLVQIKGSRDVHAGLEGVIVRPDGKHMFWVKIGKVLFRKAGRTLKVLSLAPQVEKEIIKDNLSHAVSKAYKALKARDPKFARSLKGNW